jgi:hypothetical protein
MSEYEVTVNNFIHLLLTQPSLFSEEDRNELYQLINPLPDDIKLISNSISDWCLEHPKVDNALAELDGDVGNRAPGSKKVNPNIPKPQHNPGTLLNAIVQSSPPPKEDEK